MSLLKDKGPYTNTEKGLVLGMVCLSLGAQLHSLLKDCTHDATIFAYAGRLIVDGFVPYRDGQMEANYANWLVANGVVIMTGFGEADWDNAAKAAVEGFFPGRDVIVVEALELWYWGGGVHCVTNDQPAVNSVE